MRGFVPPQLASPYRGKDAIAAGEWTAEEKYDGHRLVVHVSDEPDGLFEGRTVKAWSRYGEERLLPGHVRELLVRFPPGTFDGELLVPGGSSWDVTALDKAGQLRYVVFDAPALAGLDLTGTPYDDRRTLIRTALEAVGVGADGVLAATHWLTGREHALRLADEVWARGGEGLILKRRRSRYCPGKRNRDWIKVKQFKTEVMTVTGFLEGRLGPVSVVALEDGEGNECKVKALNDAERAAMGRDPRSYVGRRLVVEYQSRTPDGGYRHPMWDRWAEEGE